MRLKAPCQSIDFTATDIYGEPLKLEDFRGKRVMLSFFRDAACPFCNFRIYELSNSYKEWQRVGIEIIVVFSSSAAEVRHHVARYPRPFRMIADPDLNIYNCYGVEHSSKALLKALFFKLPRIIKGITTGGRPRKNPHVKIVPADFLVDIDGSVLDLWYGRDTADHIPMDRLQEFVDEMAVIKAKYDSREIDRLRHENRQLKQKLLQSKKSTHSVS